MNAETVALLDHAHPAYKQMWLQRIRWRKIAHPFQIPPKGAWRGWIMKAGRGAGKTRTGAQDAVEHCLDTPGYRYAVVAPTQSDVRATCFEGESGILYVLDQMGMGYDWNKSALELHLPNDSLMAGYSAEKPDRLRGPQFHRAWCDELAAWKDAGKGDSLNTTFNNLQFGLRLGPNAQMVITTTPKRVALFRELVAKDDFTVTTGSTYDNIDNLSPTFRDAVLKYEGSMIGRQEIHGELIEDVEGALWVWGWIEDYRLEGIPEMSRVVVGVDPSGGTAEIGVVAAGRIASPCPCGEQDQRGPHYAVLADETLLGSPETWGRRVVDTYHRLQADKVVAERNFGGDMVESTLRTADRQVPVKMVTASRGKAQRAEPVSAVYEQHRVHHIGGFPELENELTSWVPGDDWSPNRLDAMVWALTDLDLVSGSTESIYERTITHL